MFEKDPNFVLKTFEGVLQPAVPGSTKKHYRLKELERMPSPLEIWFYDDHLIIYRDRYRYGPDDIRREIDKIRYADVRECRNRLRSRRIDIFAALERTWWRYGPDGTLPEEPGYSGHHKKSMVYVYYGFDPEADILREIEDHSPIRAIAVNG